MADQKRFRTPYKTVESQEIDADIYQPPLAKVSPKGCPVLINIHGGAFMLGSSRMVNMDQVEDCLQRGWIVVAPNHRLCPQIDLLEGPIRDIRDLLAWIYEGGLQQAMNQHGSCHPRLVDLSHVFAFGTSSGGTLALCLGFGVPRPVAGIYDMYGPCKFDDPFWKTELPQMVSKIPSGLTDEFLNQVFDENPIPITGGVSLEGQAAGPPNFNDPRQAFALTQIARGNVMDTIYPSKKWEDVDPIRNVTASFPPTFIVHGLGDTMVPIDLSRALLAVLGHHGVRSGMREIPGGRTYLRCTYESGI
ncbi:uncharacterized protein PG998_008478 [Apiospora kogelbergensis]|uniref:uncharacterized protein n=1 Tax=Apiospora kogelbergensis TaxID=1337665 RepID=UPI00312EBE54